MTYICNNVYFFHAILNISSLEPTCVPLVPYGADSRSIYPHVKRRGMHLHFALNNPSSFATPAACSIFISRPYSRDLYSCVEALKYCHGRMHACLSWYVFVQAERNALLKSWGNWATDRVSVHASAWSIAWARLTLGSITSHEREPRTETSKFLFLLHTL